MSVKHADIHTITVADSLIGMSLDIIVTSAAAGPLFIVKQFSLSILLKVPHLLCNSEHINLLKVVIIIIIIIIINII
jgi:hypothetical protein